MNDTEEPRYCLACAAPLRRNDLDGCPRWRCEGCGRAHYRNPAVGVAVVLVRDATLLLGRRMRGPYAGRWCIPCGYVEWDEDIREAARRELREETGLAVRVGDVLAVHSNFHDRARQTVGVWFRGEIVGGVETPGDDLDALAWAPLARPPSLAFPTDARVIADLADGRPLRARSGPAERAENAVVARLRPSHRRPRLP